MSSIALKHVLVCASLALATSTLHAKESLGISCETHQVERAALKQAPKSVRRINKHVLEIATPRGRQRFVDKPQHDEGETVGVHWRYCGYDAHARAHLIEMIDEGSYSGSLLLEESGQLIPAGHTVWFSPDAREILGIKQDAGVDGETWAVLDRTGQIIWTGYAGIVADVDGVETVVATFELPRWTKQGQLTARSVCTSSKTQETVVLIRSASKGWGWNGHAKCL